MDVSVAMCTYNGERFLEAQLAGIAGQTKLPCELVICDDGSTDRTTEVIQAFARSVSFPVRFSRNPVNLGSTKNFEQAMGLCKGELIALCDQDDLWMPEKLERMSSILEREPKVAGVFSNATLIDDSGNNVEGTLWGLSEFSLEHEREFAEDPVFFLIHRPLVTGAAFVFRSSFVREVVPIPPELIHDEWCALILATLASIQPINQFLISYRIHTAQQVGFRKTSVREAVRLQKQERVARLSLSARKLSLMADRIEQYPWTRKSIRYARTKASYLNRRAAILSGARYLRLVRGVPLLKGHFRFSSHVISYFRDLLHS